MPRATARTAPRNWPGAFPQAIPTNACIAPAAATSTTSTPRSSPAASSSAMESTCCASAPFPSPRHLDLACGFMEAGETTEQAALREVWEESGVRADIVSPYSIFSVPKISEVYIIFRAIVTEETGQYGPETLAYKFFEPDEIPGMRSTTRPSGKFSSATSSSGRPGCMAFTWAMMTPARCTSCASRYGLFAGEPALTRIAQLQRLVQWHSPHKTLANGLFSVHPKGLEKEDRQSTWLDG